MARKKTSKSSTKRTSRGKQSRQTTAHKQNVRARTRDLTMHALTDRALSGKDISKVVHDVFDGVTATIDKSVPQSSRNVLRQVFDGMSEGVHAVASACADVAGDMRERSQTLATKDLPHAARRIRTANSEFLGAVQNFAKKTSREVRQELNTLVEQAKRTGPKVASSARHVGNAAEGRWTQLAGETARAGMRAARTGTSYLAMSAAGLFDAVADVIAGKRSNTSASSRSSTTRTKPRTKTAATRSGAKKKMTKKRTTKNKTRK